MAQNAVAHLCEIQARNQLGTPGGEEFSEKGQNFFNFFKLCPIVLNYVQHIFPGGREKNFEGELCTPSNGPGEMAPVAKLKCASLLIIYVSYIDTIFMKVKTSRTSIF